MRRTFPNPILLLVVGAVGVVLYKAWKDRQRALAHPISAPNPTNFITPIRMDATLVPGTPIVQ